MRYASHNHPDGARVRLLIVEDDGPLAASLTAALRRSGHAVDCVSCGVDAASAIEMLQYDLMILDLGLPDIDGISLLRRLRDRRNVIPTLILTARDAVRTRIQALDAGADDYLLKPFDFGELEARIRAVTRRRVAGSAGNVEIGRLRLMEADRCIYLAERPLVLSPREYGVLELLMHRQGRVVSKQQIQSRLCGWGEELTEGAIEIYVHRVRRKLEGSGVSIRTVRGFGYLLEMTADA